MKLSEVFGSPESHAEGAIVFIDMADSTSMKEQESEATWLTTYAWFFDLIREKVLEHSGHVVKYLGDGAMAYFDMRDVANAINAAIAIQEELKKADRNKKVYVTCTIGIATGKFRTFQTPESAPDYIGSIVDRAARLGSAASPMAIFVDRSTINSAMMSNVRSKLGELLNWSDDDYTGNQQKISLKGFSQPVPYHEIKWDQQLYGIKSEVLTKAADNQEKLNSLSIPSMVIKPEQQEQSIKSPLVTKGLVKLWNSDKNFGFIVSNEDGEEFYTNTKYSVNGITPQVGQQVLFFPRDPIGNSRNRLASTVVIMGEKYSGVITRISSKDPNKQLATISLSDSNHTVIDFFAFLGLNPDDLRRGDIVEFYAAQNEKGPKANTPCKCIYIQA